MGLAYRVCSTYRYNRSIIKKLKRSIREKNRETGRVILTYSNRGIGFFPSSSRGSLQEQIDGMNNSVCGGYIGSDDVTIVHLNLAICLLQRQWGATRHGVLDLIETHSGAEEGSVDQMFRNEFLGQILVRDQVRQLLGREFGERIIGRREYSVSFNA